ncbi:MAG: DUF4912 domain-containing protein [Nitrospirota bacterium]
MASKRPRKLKSSQRTGSRAARSSRAPVAVKRTPAIKKKPAAAKKAAAPKRVKRAAPARATAKPAAQDTSHATPEPTRSTSLPRSELLAQAKAAAIPSRHRMTLAQLRAALVRLADQPAAAASSGSGWCASIAPTPPPAVAGLPWRYGVTELVAMPVDPVLVHVYWELAADAIAKVRAHLGPWWDGASQVLRAYDVADAPSHDGDNGALVVRARHHFDFDIAGEVGNYYIHLWSPNQTLIFEIGWRARDGRFAAAMRSNQVATPRNASDEGGAERWLTVRNGRIVTSGEPVGVNGWGDRP